jgi:ribosomal protein L7/L12
MSEEPWQRDVVDALRRGMKIEAIKLYREGTGVGLAEAKSFVEALEDSLKTGELPPPAPTGEELEDELTEHLRGGNLIGAIKRHREATGSGLVESKRAMESLASRKGIPVPSPTPIAIWVLIAALVLGGIIAAFFLNR